MKRILFAAIITILAAGVAAAQDFPRVEVFGGYDLLRFGGSDFSDMLNSLDDDFGVPVSTSKLFKKGFDASIAFNANDYFGIEANFLYNRGELAKATGSDEEGTYDARFKAYDFAFMAGPRFAYRKNERVTPFAHALFGFNHIKNDPTLTVNGEDLSGDEEMVRYAFSDTGFGMAFGGGIDVNVNKVFGVRLIQADYLMAKHEDVTLHNLNLAFGVVFRLGGK